MHPWRQRGGTAWAASRVPRGWAAGHQLAGTALGGRRERRAEATGKQLGRPRKRGPARRGACSGVSFRTSPCNIGAVELRKSGARADAGAEERSETIERSVRQSLCLTATMPITAAARVLSHWTLPAPPAARAPLWTLPWRWWDRSRGRRVRLSPSVYGSLSRSLSRLAPIPALGRALGARRKRKVPFPELCEHRRHVPVKQLLDGLAPCLFKRSGGYERWEE